jgi:4-amino-4-deoxy-L-arabinose transferase-like glycosyltransferase
VAVYLPAADSLFTWDTHNDPATNFYSDQAPGYSVFLALAQGAGPGWHLTVVVCLQMLLDYATAVSLLFLADDRIPLAVGWLAGIIWLLFPPAIVLSTWITAETLFAALLVPSIVILVRSLSSASAARLSFAAGLGLGIATLVRGTTQFLPFALFIIAAVPAVSRRVSKCALCLAGTCLVVLPWTARNVHVLGEPIIVQTGFGAVFLQGSRSEYFTIDGKWKGYELLKREGAVEGIAQPTDAKATSRDRWNLDLGLRNYRVRLRQEPLSLIPFVIHKFTRLWYGVETGTILRQIALGICSLMVVPLAVLQIWRWRRHQPELSLVLALVLVYFIGIHMIGYPEFRYMMPIFPLLIFAASPQYSAVQQATDSCAGLVGGLSDGGTLN